MSDQIKARGWIWERSMEETQWVAKECYYCQNVNVFPSMMKDAHMQCKDCNGNYFYKYYVRKVRMVKG